jgi:hypothetical protein
MRKNLVAACDQPPCDRPPCDQPPAAELHPIEAENV